METDPVILRALPLVRKHLAAIPEHHGFAHVHAVYKLACHALDCEPGLTTEQRRAVKLAALFHENHDRKFFPCVVEGEFHDTRVMLDELGILDHRMVLTMIALTSVSKRGLDGGDAVPGWMLICSDCDRLEALGQVGIARCLAYARDINLPLVAEDTPRPRSMEQLMALVTPARMAAYVARKTSASVLDHFLDKLLHLRSTESKNPALEALAQARHAEMVAFALRLAHGDKHFC